MLRSYLRVRTIALPRGRLMITAPRAPDVPRTIIALRLLCTTVTLGLRVTTTAPRARDGCLTIIALRVRPTITAPRAPRVRPSAAWRVRLTIAVLRRPCTIVVRDVGVTAASPRAPLTAAVRRMAALASGDATVMTPKNAVMPNAASTGTDKRMLSPCYLVQRVSPHSKALFGMPARRFSPGTLFRIIASFFRKHFWLTYFQFQDKPECWLPDDTQ
jgi:hypothetical protein